jgi:non-ribosomal peptide synthetase component F
MNNFFTLFEKTAQKFSGRVAVSCGGENITFGELYDAAILYGERLKTESAERILPVTVPAGIEWFTEVLGIFSANKAAVPISTVLPPERAEFILSDIKNADNLPHNAALIYYTSGSTGNPKGVILTHSGIVSFAKSHGKLFNYSELHTCAVSSDPGFDAFLLMCIPALLFGVTIVITPDEVRASLVSLHKFLLKNKIELTFMTTQLALSYMRTFDNKCLKALLTGGETLKFCVMRSYDIWNLYGPCEATIYVTAHRLTESDTEAAADIPIGKATGKNRVFTDDGEICISGPQLAAGYLNRPDETAKRFVSNPYYDPGRDDDVYRLMYRTGDRGEFGVSGDLLFRGRVDSQIKISGYRIEPGEIEAKIMSCTGIADVKVSGVQNTNGEYALFALCVGDTNESALRAELEQKLPRAMIPSVIEFDEKIKTDPRTGKGVLIS